MEQIQINDLHFTYPLGKEEALSGVDLKIRAGEYIALCGESGCGKTTLLRLLKSALSPEGKKSGSITVNGTDIRNVTVSDLTSRLSIVPQKAFLFSGWLSGRDQSQFLGLSARQKPPPFQRSVCPAHLQTSDPAF